MQKIIIKVTGDLIKNLHLLSIESHFCIEETPEIIQRFVILMILSERVSYRALYDVLAPLAHVGTVLNRRTALLFPVPAAVRIPGSQTIPTITKTHISDMI